MKQFEKRFEVLKATITKQRDALRDSRQKLRRLIDDAEEIESNTEDAVEALDCAVQELDEANNHLSKLL